MSTPENEDLERLTFVRMVFCEALCIEAGISDASRYDCYSAVVDGTHRRFSLDELRSWGENEFAQAAAALNKYFETNRISALHVSKAVAITLKRCVDPNQTPQGRIASEFAKALVAGNFDQAHKMLSSAAKRDWDPGKLRTRYLKMVGYFESPPNFVEVMEAMSEAEDKEPLDVGWAYAAIMGEGESEAVAVVVSSEGGKHLIRSITWGRP
jgi:hypothetical protein